MENIEQSDSNIDEQSDSNIDEQSDSNIDEQSDSNKKIVTEWMRLVFHKSQQIGYKMFHNTHCKECALMILERMNINSGSSFLNCMPFVYNLLRGMSINDSSVYLSDEDHSVIKKYVDEYIGTKDRDCLGEHECSIDSGKFSTIYVVYDDDHENYFLNFVNIMFKCLYPTHNSNPRTDMKYPLTNFVNIVGLKQSTMSNISTVGLYVIYLYDLEKFNYDSHRLKHANDSGYNILFILTGENFIGRETDFKISDEANEKCQDLKHALFMIDIFNPEVVSDGLLRLSLQVVNLKILCDAFDCLM